MPGQTALLLGFLGWQPRIAAGPVPLPTCWAEGVEWERARTPRAAKAKRTGTGRDGTGRSGPVPGHIFFLPGSEIGGTEAQLGNPVHSHPTRWGRVAQSLEVQSLWASGNTVAAFLCVERPWPPGCAHRPGAETGPGEAGSCRRTASPAGIGTRASGQKREGTRREGTLRRDVLPSAHAGPAAPPAAPHRPHPQSPRRAGWAGRETRGSRAIGPLVPVPAHCPASARRLAADADSRRGAEAESGIGGPAVPGSRPRAPPGAASPLWRRPCRPPCPGRPPGSPAAAAAVASAVASVFPPASGRAPPLRCRPLRCGKGPSCVCRGAAASAANGHRAPRSPLPRRPRAGPGAEPRALMLGNHEVRLGLGVRAGGPGPGRPPLGRGRGCRA